MQTRPARESTAAIDAMHADGLRQGARKVVIDHLREIAVGRTAEQARPRDHRLRAGVDEFLGAPHAAHAAADSAGELRRDLLDERIVVAARHRGVEIDQLDFGELRKLGDPAVEIVGGNREFVTLNELDDAPALQINRRNQHKVLRTRATEAQRHGGILLKSSPWLRASVACSFTAEQESVAQQETLSIRGRSFR